jgi:pimeloyl-ACP methyl ester carboxylesterase
MPVESVGWQQRLGSLGIMLVSRSLMLRDAVTGVARRLPKPKRAESFFFASGGRRLAAVCVAGDDRGPVVLLCHGIGETVGHWSAVQAFFELRGIGSMVFNYSGYGRSEGAIRAAHCDQDFVAAYAELRRRVGEERAVFVLGFSLGSGIAGCGLGKLRPAPAGLFLCEAFPSFREAVRAAGVPGRLVRFAPEIWDTVAAMRFVEAPVCVVHSDADRLFPVEMGRRIAEACGGELVVVAGLSHNEPYLRPTEAYWGVVVERVRTSHSSR